MQQFPRLSSDWKRFFAADDPTLHDALLRLLAEIEELGGSVDFDRLMIAGRRFAVERRQDADEVVVSWLASKPSLLRLDIASAFLTGIWTISASDHPINESGVSRFITLRNSLALDDELAFSSLGPIFALAKASPTPAVEKLLKHELDRAMGEHYNSPQLAKQARELINEVIHRLDQTQST
jgi:hypothetical protein